MRFSLTSSQQQIVFVLGLFFVLCLALVPIPEVGSSSEAREVHVAELIHEQGMRLVPQRLGIIASKPPLYHWISAGLAQLVGEVSPTLTRSVSMVFAWLMLWLGYFLACLLVPQKDEARQISFATLLILSTNYEFVRLAIDSRVDMTFAFFVFASIYSIIRCFGSHSDYAFGSTTTIRGSDVSLFLLFAACATLTKGPLGFVLPAVFIVCFCCSVIGFRASVMQLCKPRIAWLLYLIPVGLWYGVGSMQRGGDFFYRHVMIENINRAFGGDLIVARPLWYYLESLIVKMPPWGLCFVVLALLEGFGKLRLSTGRVDKIRNAILYATVLVLFLLSLASGKRTAYLLPLVPLISIYIAWTGSLLCERCSESQRAMIYSIGRAVVDLLPAVLLCMVLALELSIYLNESTNPLLAHAASVLTMHRRWLQWVLLMVLAILFLALSQKDTSHLRAIRALPALFVMLAAVQIGLAIKYGFRNNSAHAHDISRLVSMKSLAAVKPIEEEWLDPVLFYLDRPARIVSKPHTGCPAEYVLGRDRYIQKILDGVLLRYVKSFRPITDQMDGRSDRVIRLARCETTRRHTLSQSSSRGESAL